MRYKFLALLTALAATASCAPRPAPPRPAPPPPVPQPQPRPPAPVPTPPPAQWEDMPLAAGDWTYRSDGAASVASFGAFTLRCEQGGRVSLSLAGAGRSPLTIRTTFAARSLAAEQRSGALVALLPAGDGLLDQIAFSRGRFAVEAEGAGRLILPAWPETARVVEDCRG